MVTLTAEVFIRVDMAAWVKPQIDLVVVDQQYPVR
jgi:hypothetical protein